ncbi:MAG: hypothetical protein HOH50_07330 [Planctomycetaceae bacterium]|jgi:hypothetical protein|nr:hypothetical protein [Planctomycetaceae bacterium]MBT5884022.1 hypothetical protein [Planctomycetaceae bacterium]
MSLIKLNTNPPLAQLKSFGRLWTPLFAIIIGVNVVLNGHFVAAMSIQLIAVVVVLVAWCCPKMLKYPFVVAMVVTYPIGVIVGWLLLRAIYYGCLCPIGLMLKVFKKDLLQQRWDLNSASYWTDRRDVVGSHQYFRQF